ncbi:MAG: hypothetical protein PF637_11490 [Spirochaetes bacterium]|jgi:hypothetical protein|nr:hypothetical protein [Spirochaetota bacterium]
MIQLIKNTVLDIVSYIAEIVIRFFSFLFNWFMDLVIWERLILINFVAAFFAVLLPVARFYILDFWYVVSNPLSINMIGLVFVMFATIFFPYLIILIARVTLNLLYIIHMLIIVLSGSITHAPDYLVTPGLFLNFVVPLLFILFSVLSFNNRR